MDEDILLKLKEAVKKDFHVLYVPEFTASYKADRLIRNIEINIMGFPNLELFIEKYFNPKNP